MSQGEPKHKMYHLFAILSLPSQLVYLITTDGGGTHLLSTKRNRILEKIYLIPIRALDCLTNAMFSQGLLSVSVSFAASLCYVATNTTKAQEFTS